jgi:hypothetical protein
MRGAAAAIKPIGGSSGRTDGGDPDLRTSFHSMISCEWIIRCPSFQERFDLGLKACSPGSNVDCLLGRSDRLGHTRGVEAIYARRVTLTLAAF